MEDVMYMCHVKLNHNCTAPRQAFLLEFLGPRTISGLRLPGPSSRRPPISICQSRWGQEDLPVPNGRHSTKFTLITQPVTSSDTCHKCWPRLTGFILDHARKDRWASFHVKHILSGLNVGFVSLHPSSQTWLQNKWLLAMSSQWGGKKTAGTY